MTGYVRKDTTNNIADGNVINAADLDNEFDGVQDAFNASTGHNHDGTSGEGAPITALGPTQDVTISATLLAPKTTNTVDIGSSALKFKDLFLAGNGSIGGTLAVTGVATLTAQPILSSLTASRAVFTDGSKGLVSNAITGTGNVVMSASPTLTGTVGGASLTLSSLTSGRVTYAGTSGLLQDDADLTFDGTTLSTAGLTASGTVTLSGGTANGVAYLNGSKVVTSGSALTFDGTTLSTGGNFSLAGAGTGTRYVALLNETNTYAGSLNMQAGGGSSGFGGGVTMYGHSNASYAGAVWLGYSSGTSTGILFGSGGNGVGSELMRLNATGLGIGTSSPATKLDVSGAASTNSESRFVAKLADTSSVAQGNGGGLVFRGVYTGSTLVDASGIQAYKENATDGNYAYGLAFVTRANGGNLTANMRLDGAGNLGLGVTPSAWISAYKALEIGTTTGLYGRTDSTMEFVLALNGYRASSGSWIYRNTGAAARYNQNTGAHWWDVAPSGTAGNAITFTQAMTLDASGNLGVGTTSPAERLHIFKNTYPIFKIESSSYNSTMGIDTGNGNLVITNVSNAGLVLSTNNTERARITSGGALVVGVTSPQIATSIYASGNSATDGVIGARNGTGNSTFQVVMDSNNNCGYLGTSSPSGTALIRLNGEYGIQFTSGGSERARIDSSGNLLVGATTAHNFGIPSIQAGGSNANAIISVRRDTTSSADQVLFYNPNGNVGGISTSGSATTYSTSSDYRLKNTILPMTGALAKVALLKPCTYKWNADGSDGEGFIAHELQAIIPDAVVGEKDAVDAEGNPKYQGIDTSFLVATLTAAIKEQQAIIESLKARLDAANL